MTLSTAVIITANANQAKAEVRALAAETDKVTASTKGFGTAGVTVGGQVAAFEGKVESLTDAIGDLAAKEETAAASMRTGLAPAMGAVGSGGLLAGNGMRGFTQQLSQVGQQTMATGQFVQALAIQLPDIGLAFGTAGTAAGLLAGIALPMLWAALSSGTQNIKELSEKVEALSAATTAYKNSAEAALQPTSDLSARYGTMADTAERALRSMAAADKQSAISSMSDAVKVVSGSLLEYHAISAGAGRGTGAALGLADDFGLAADAADRLEQALFALRTAEGVEAQARAALEVANALDAARDSAGNLPAPLQEAYAQMAAMAEQGSAIVGTTQQIENATYSVMEAALAAASAVGNIGASAAAAYGPVAALASSLWAAANAKVQAAKYVAANQVGGSAYMANQYAQYGAGRVAGETAAKASDDRYWQPSLHNNKSAGGGRGGSAKAAKEEADAVGDLIKKLEAERDLARETDPIQREMLKYRKQLAGATKEERARVEELIRAETQLKAVREASDFFASQSLDLLKGLAAGGDEAANAMAKLGNAILDAALQALVLGKGPLADLFGMSGNLLSGLFGGGGGGGGLGALFRAEGGMVFGAGGPREDKIPMWGSAGEFMVNAKATARYRPLLEQINSGAGVPGFAAGGAIGGGAANSLFAPQRPLEIHNHIHGATGNTEIRQMVAEGVQYGIGLHDREVLPSRVMAVVNNQRVQGR